MLTPIQFLLAEVICMLRVEQFFCYDILMEHVDATKLFAQ